MVREQRKARKAHFCEMCGRLIYPGMDYIWQAGKKNGWHWTTKMHLHCDALQEEAEKHLRSGSRTNALATKGRQQRGERIENSPSAGLDRERGQDCYSADVRHWIEENVCANCAAENECPEDEVYSCRNALYMLLPERYLEAATKSAADLRAKEKL